MNQQFIETYTVPGMDSQTAVAVQSLIDSQVITEATPVDEDDVFQCGKCKKQFCSLSAFLGHKQARCNGQRTIVSQPIPRSNPNVQDIIITTNSRASSQAATESVPVSRATQVIQSSIPSFNNAAIAQNMMLTDDLMSFSNIDHNLGNQTLQLGSSNSSGGSYLPQVTTFSVQSPNSVTILGPVSSAPSLTPGTSTYSSANHIQIQPAPSQQATLVTRAEKNIANSIVKPSPTKAGRKSAQAQANVNFVNVRMRRSKSGSIIVEGEKKKLVCQYCNKTFTKNFDLQQHIRAHTGEKPFQCIVCGRAFAQKSNVKKHMNTHKVWPAGTGKTLPAQPPLEVENIITEQPEPPAKVVQKVVVSEKEFLKVEREDNNTGSPEPKEDSRTKVMIDNSYICQYCPCKFKTYFHLKSHMVQHKNQQVFKCSMAKCSQVFKELDGFLEHIKEHECEMTYRCHICSKMFVSLYELGLHQYTHSLYPQQGPKTGPRHFQCTRCQNKYSSPEALEHHINTSSHDHPCPHCNKSFTCERYLRRHLPSHGSEGQFQCPTCHKKFKAEHYLKMHALIHTGETPFACEICKTAFNRKDKLKRHMLIHENSKRYKCPFKAVTGCTKEFSRTDKLKSHIVTHSGVRPFKCGECGRCFSRKPHLIEHERGHRADYKFKCQVCHKGFFRPKLFKEHKCVPSKNGEAPPRVYRPRNKRKVGRPRKRMITVETSKESISDVRVQNVMVIQSQNDKVVKENETQIVEGPSIEVSTQEEAVTEENDKAVMKSDKPPFCVKVTAPVPRYLAVNVHSQPNSILGHGIQTHFIQTSTSGSGFQNLVSTNSGYQPITILEPIPIQVAQLDNVALSDQLSLQMTSLQGGVTVSDNNVSVIESVPVQVVMPAEDPDNMMTTHVVVSSSGPDQGYPTSQLEDFTGSEGDPVLQGTENLLKAHAEILQSAQ